MVKTATVKQKVLFDDNDEDQNDESLPIKKDALAINEKYAQRYDTWRSKEEMQKLKDKYGDVDGESESTDESEDEDAKELTKDVEIEFFKTLSLVKSKDTKIYDKEKCKFFENMSEHLTVKSSKEKEKKPFLMKDLEREMILKKMKKSENGLDTEDDEEENKIRKPIKPGYYEEQDEIKKSIKQVADIDNSEADEESEADFLLVKSKTKEEKDKEEADYIEWLKGRKQKVDNPELEKNMKYLHDYWNDPNLNESEKYLRDYLLNKRYLDKDDSGSDGEDEENEKVPKKAKLELKSKNIENAPLDYADFSEEEKEVERQEEFERKYNFRFEDPDPEFIKSYPRTVADSMRRKETKRKEKREEYKKRKDLEKTKIKEEIKRLKSLKRKEIENKIEKLKKISGLENMKITVEDLEKDFDPEEYDKKIEGNVFNDEYYQIKEFENDYNDEDKPVFTDDDEEDLKYENWDEWKPLKEEKKSKKKKRKAENEQDQDPNFEMDCEKSEELTAKSKKVKLVQLLLRKKPVFDENEKTFEEYFDEYYKLDCEDVIGGDLPCRFKYREVVPNDFGLSLEEIFGSKDTELNEWASLKKVTNYRSTSDEINDLKLYKNKKNQIESKKKILASVYNPNEEDDDNDDEEHENEKRQEMEKKETEVPASNSVTEPIQNEKKNKDKNKLDKSKKEKKSAKKNEIKEEEIDVNVSIAANTQPEKKISKKTKPKKKNKNILESITDERLLAYGIEPKKFHKKIKYSNKNQK